MKAMHPWWNSFTPLDEHIRQRAGGNCLKNSVDRFFCMFRCWIVATNFRGKLSLRRENISEKKTTFAKVTFNSAPYNPTKSQLENVTNKRKTILNLSGWVEWRCIGRLTLRDLFGKPPCGLLWVGKLKISLVLYHEVGWHFLWPWWLLDMKRAFVN